MRHYWLGKSHVSGTFCSKCIKCQNPYQQQNLKILLIFRDSKYYIFRTKLLYISLRSTSSRNSKYYKCDKKNWYFHGDLLNLKIDKVLFFKKMLNFKCSLLHVLLVKILHCLFLGKTATFGLVVKALDSQSMGPVFKTTGRLKVDSAFHPSKVNDMRTRHL